MLADRYSVDSGKGTSTLGDRPRKGKSPPSRCHTQAGRGASLSLLAVAAEPLSLSDDGLQILNWIKSIRAQEVDDRPRICPG